MHNSNNTFIYLVCSDLSNKQMPETNVDKTVATNSFANN